MSQRMSKRQQVAAAKRAAVLRSKAFQEWWSARQNIRPIPADPYRAFMIDLSLFARVHRKPIWRMRTNRMDYPPIDLPRGVPSEKRRLPSRKEMRRFKKVPKPARPRVVTAQQKKLLKVKERFLRKLHLPEVEVVFEPELGQLTSAYWRGLPSVSKPRIKLGARGLKRGALGEAQVEATMLHELGHHAHYYTGFPSGRAVSHAAVAAPRIEKERKAWEIADPFLVKFRPSQKFFKKYALGTYLGTSPFSAILGVRKKRR